jgi:hypothetical protein
MRPDMRWRSDTGGRVLAAHGVARADLAWAAADRDGRRPATYARVRQLVAALIIGEGVYRLNTHSRVLAMMNRRHVYAQADRVTEELVARKQTVARRPAARFASVAFVTGALDRVADRQAFQALLSPPPTPTLVLCGTATPPKSKAEMEAIPAADAVDVRWVPGSLGLNEEQAEAISGLVGAFLQAPAPTL